MGSIEELTEIINEYFEETYNDFLPDANNSHPILPPKPSKIIHDSLWGTNRFEWYEMAIIDSPPIQRLRDIFQVGSASYVFPSATHNRFEHSLGTAIVATKVFDSLSLREASKFGQIASDIDQKAGTETFFNKMRQELRLAGILHDSGHTLFSHTSEPSHHLLDLLKDSAQELTDLVAKERSTGETISYCIAKTKFVQNIVRNYEKRIPTSQKSEYAKFEADINEVALMIIGKTKHKYTQFVADILTSGFDADKLDYLLRDGISAGLPVKYDLDRYLEFVTIGNDLREIKVQEDVNSIKKLYNQDVSIGDQWKEHRLRLPENAINSMEQIIIGKFMLFGYIYHHPKVRAMDSYIDRTLRQVILRFKGKDISEKRILKWLLGLTDSTFRSLPKFKSEIQNNDLYNTQLIDCAYRLETRTLPREVFSVNGSSVSDTTRDQVIEFFVKLQDQDNKAQEIQRIEEKIKKELGGKDTDFWVDLPKPPSFEDVKKMMGKVQFFSIFPIDKWTEAYMHYTYKMRIFTFSENVDALKKALSSSLPKILNIETKDVDDLMRKR